MGKGKSRDNQLEVGDWLARLLIKVPEEFTIALTLPSQDGYIPLPHSKIPRVCHQSIRKAAIYEEKDIFISLNTLRKRVKGKLARVLINLQKSNFIIYVLFEL